MCSETNASVQPVGRPAPASGAGYRLHTSVRRFVPSVCRHPYFPLRTPLSRVRTCGISDPGPAAASPAHSSEDQTEVTPVPSKIGPLDLGKRKCAQECSPTLDARPPLPPGSSKFEEIPLHQGLVPSDFEPQAGRTTTRASHPPALPLRARPSPGGAPRSTCSKRRSEAAEFLRIATASTRTVVPKTRERPTYVVPLWPPVIDARRPACRRQLSPVADNPLTNRRFSKFPNGRFENRNIGNQPLNARGRGRNGRIDSEPQAGRTVSRGNHPPALALRGPAGSEPEASIDMSEAWTPSMARFFGFRTFSREWLSRRRGRRVP
ncbi:hypothetical protein BHAOGJBA_1367 [Methylobacterium hispanicum]|uniref:Uncharacterized protein n=1 Tax=Methylobacterium hispanicum TaxID=270350 RepID=A0AAV4ZHD6_9HYPH|nr:hypothetical protein BHAOGJBA_1367 [Methylobacterium hispanicum]